MDDLDAALARLRDGPVHPGLATMDVAVFDVLAARARSSPMTGGAVGMAAAMALILGIVGSVFPGVEAKAAFLSPFGGSSALAPSTILGAGK